MAIKTPCQTPGAVFHTKISLKKIESSIDLPNELPLTKEEAKVLEANIHNAMEMALAPYFTKTVK
jgi:hypothetical protein